MSRRLVLAASALLLATGCRPDCTARSPQPNVLLVTVDTLRVDQLGCYGNRTVRTPSLDRLANEGALFEHAWAQAPITVPSHLSILSSVPLAVHGVVTNNGPPARQVDVLPALFARAGYRTAAFVSARHLGPGGVLTPLLAGLETYRGPKRNERRAEDTNADVLPWLRDACRDPWFAWVHYFDPHMPYAPPAPFDTMYDHADAPASPTDSSEVVLNWYALDMNGLRRRLGRQAHAVRALKRETGLRTRRLQQTILYPVGLEAYARDPAARAALRDRIAAVAARLRRDTPYKPVAAWLNDIDDPRLIRARYAGEVSYVDQQIGRLYDELGRLGVADRTIVVVTADHGESLGEHGIWCDHFGLYEPSLHVPLIVWAPGRATPGRHAEPARGLDVAPTILTLAGLAVPPAMEGRDLLAAGAATAEPRTLVAESSRGYQIALRRGPWKLIRTRDEFYYVDAFARTAGQTELFDLARDPGERADRATADPGTRGTLAGALDGWLAGHRLAPAAPPAAPVAPAVEKSLRALGYVE